MKNDNRYNFCRYCSYFDGKTQNCTNDRAFNLYNFEPNVNPFIEDGNLSEAINEALNDGQKFYEALNHILRFGLERPIPNKRIEEILKQFQEKMEFDILVNLTEKIDGSVSRALLNYDFSEEINGVEINYPSEFRCNYFM